jgi:hypothetical protein
MQPTLAQLPETSTVGVELKIQAISPLLAAEAADQEAAQRQEQQEMVRLLFLLGAMS